MLTEGSGIITEVDNYSGVKTNMFALLVAIEEKQMKEGYLGLLVG